MSRLIQNRWFGDVETVEDGTYVRATVELNGRTSACDVYLAAEIATNDDLWVSAVSALNQLNVLDQQARARFPSELTATDATVRDYLDFHLEEPVFADEAEVVAALTSPDPRAHLLASLSFSGVGIGADDNGTVSTTMDYKPGAFTDEILCVKFDAAGQIVHVAHES